MEMNSARRTAMSLAAFVLICFFLPWLQLSCVGMRDSLSGFDLARSGDRFLWFIPFFMSAILVCGLVRLIWEKVPSIFALAGIVGGGATAYLLYHERSITNDSPRLVETQWTFLFWLELLAAFGIVAFAFIYYVRRARSP
jgi:hypothetical protein